MRQCWWKGRLSLSVTSQTSGKSGRGSRIGGCTCDGLGGGSGSEVVVVMGVVFVVMVVLLGGGGD